MFITRSLLIVITYSLSISTICKGQQFIGCVNEGSLYSIDVLGNICSTRPITKCSSVQAFSIAIYKDSIYSVQRDSLMCSFLTPSGATSCRYVMRVPAFMNALTSDSTGILYGASEDSLFRINPATNTFNFLGKMQFFSAGDLFFFQGKLYLSALSPSAGIVQININNPMQSILVLPISNYNLYGLVSVPADCSRNVVFGLAATVNNNTTILEIDMATLQIASIGCTLPFIVNDAASITETGSNAGIGIQSIVAYPECTNKQNSGSLQINVRGSIPGSIYQYTVNGATNSTGIFGNLTAGLYNIHITATGGCVKDTFATIGLTSVPTLQMTSVSDTCKRKVGMLQASAIGGLNPYVFQLDTMSQISGSFSNLAAGQYQLQVTDKNRCTVIQNFTIENVLAPAPSISITTVGPNCYNRNNGSVSLTISGNRTPYSISIAGGIYSQQNNFMNLSAGNFNIKVKDFQGCITDTAAIVPQYVINRPSISVDSASPTCLQPNTGFVQLNVINNANLYFTSYLNKRYPSNYRFNNLSQGNYLFTVVDSVNCGLYTIDIPLKKVFMPGCNTIYVPNAFTPNNDGNNDLFKATAYGNLSRFSLSIYNRFGNLVFKSLNENKGWNGNYDGQPQSSASFVWVIDYSFEGEPIQHQKGTFLLIR